VYLNLIADTRRLLHRVKNGLSYGRSVAQSRVGLTRKKWH